MRPLILSVCLATGLAAASGTAAASSPSETMEVDVKTGPRVTSEVLDYATGGITYQGYLARNASLTGPRPAVLVLHERWGLDRYARARADQLAALGFVALAVDMYGNGQLVAHPDEAHAFSRQVLQDWPAARARLEAAMARLAEHSAVAVTGVAALGYGFGGSVVMNMALAGMPLEAAISFHGVPISAVTTPRAFDGQVQLHHGAEDALVERDALVAMASRLKGQGAEVEVISYPRAGHGFSNPYADRVAAEQALPLAYNAAADASSWQSALLALDAALNDN